MSPDLEKFTELDQRCINCIRILAADMVQRANSGHPGAPMGLAPLVHVLFTRFLQCSPSDPKWLGRDRFVMSNGHGCALQYIMLHLMGYSVSMDDLKAFRQVDSMYRMLSSNISSTPGHPENILTPGVEVTTGPLGQGVANGVGLAAAEAHLSATYGLQVFNNRTFVLCGDGCMMEGIASEAASLAGHLSLHKLTIIYDDNQISIDGKTDLAFSEDVARRFEAYGFSVFTVEDGDGDLDSIYESLKKAIGASKPSMIRLRTTIGKGAAGMEGTAKVHGAPLGASNVAATKRSLGFDPEQYFYVPDDVRAFYNESRERGERKRAAWDVQFAEYGRTNPERAREIETLFVSKKLPQGWLHRLPRYEGDEKRTEATRKDSEHVLNAIAPEIANLVGGSADLTESNLSKWKGSIDFQAPSSMLGDYSGRYFRFGVREHAMFAMCNGMAAYGGLIPFAATFLNFITYGWGAVRLSALSHFQVIYVMTHDSIGLGEDGPTHQPIETLAAIRALPNCILVRPADGNEVSGAYRIALEHRTGPTVICLTRQKVANLQLSSPESVLRGAYIVRRAKTCKLVLVSTGSEVSLCIESAAQSAHPDSIQVISMPSWELFEQQSGEYKAQIFPEECPVISVEAGSTLGWDRYADVCIGLDRFGKSGPYLDVYKSLGLSVERLTSIIGQAFKHFANNPVRTKKRLQI